MIQLFFLDNGSENLFYINLDKMKDVDTHI